MCVFSTWLHDVHDLSIGPTLQLTMPNTGQKNMTRTSKYYFHPIGIAPDHCDIIRTLLFLFSPSRSSTKSNIVQCVYIIPALMDSMSCLSRSFRLSNQKQYVAHGWTLFGPLCNKVQSKEVKSPWVFSIPYFLGGLALSEGAPFSEYQDTQPANKMARFLNKGCLFFGRTVGATSSLGAPNPYKAHLFKYMPSGRRVNEECLSRATSVEPGWWLRSGWTMLSAACYRKTWWAGKLARRIGTETFRIIVRKRASYLPGANRQRTSYLSRQSPFTAIHTILPKTYPLTHPNGQN